MNLGKNSNLKTKGVVDKMTRTPDGSVDVLAIDEFVMAASASLMSNPQPFYDRGYNESNCSTKGALNAQTWMTRIALISSMEYCHWMEYRTEVPSSLMDLYIDPGVELDPQRVWLSVDGEPVVL